MAIVVRKVPMEHVQDTSGIEAAMAEEGRLEPLNSTSSESLSL